MQLAFDPAIAPAAASCEDVEAGRRWAAAAYEMADAHDVGIVRKYLTEDSVVQFGSAPPIKGWEAIEKNFTWQFNAGKGEHIIHDIQVLPDKVIVTFTATFTTTKGAETSINCIGVWNKSTQSDKATGGVHYGDFSQVFTNFIAASGPPPA